MKVTARALLIALRQVFRDEKVYENGRLLMRDVDILWRKTGFRQEDLVRTIELGEAFGMFRRERVEGESVLRILHLELPDNIGEHDTVKRLLESMSEASTLRKARHRARNGSPPATERRHTDNK